MGVTEGLPEYPALTKISRILRAHPSASQNRDKDRTFIVVRVGKHRIRHSKKANVISLWSQASSKEDKHE